MRSPCAGWPPRFGPARPPSTACSTAVTSCSIAWSTRSSASTCRRKRRAIGARTWPPWPAMLTAHPWLGNELAGRPAIGPYALIHHERALEAAAGYADDPTAASGAVETVLAYVLGAAARELAETQTQRRSGLTEEQWRAAVAPYLQQALNSGSYPHLERMVHEATDLDADERFERGLACVLAGLATYTS